MLVWAPIPLGSNRAWAWSLLEVAACGLLALWLGCYALGKVTFTEPFRRAKWFFALLGLWLLYQVFFILPLPRAAETKELSKRDGQSLQPKYHVLFRKSMILVEASSLLLLFSVFVSF